MPSKRPPADELLLPQAMVDPATLNEHPENPKLHNWELLKASVLAGLYRSVVVNRGTHTGRPDEILAGHGTRRVWMELYPGRPIQVSYVDVDEQRASEILLVDNPNEHDPGLDPQKLANVLLSLNGDLALTGFQTTDLTALLETLDRSDLPADEVFPDDVQLNDPDEVPAVPDAAVSRPGDVWVLGDHRVMCGDSTSAGDVSHLLLNTMVDAMWTDPPYGVSYVGGTADKLTIANDGAKDLPALLNGAFRAAVLHFRPGAPFYVAHADTERVAFQAALVANGYRVRQNLIWVKNALVLGRSDYHYQHEPVLYGDAPDPGRDADTVAAALDPDERLTRAEWAALADAETSYPEEHGPVLYGFTPGGEGRLGRGGPRWLGNHSQTTVFHIPKPAASRQHPTMKPVQLIVDQLRNHVRPRMVVLDLFGGSGSTVLAAQQLHAAARVMELDPKYVDVIVRRWQDHYGKTAVHAETGAAFNDTKPTLLEPAAAP